MHFGSGRGRPDALRVGVWRRPDALRSTRVPHDRPASEAAASPGQGQGAGRATVAILDTGSGGRRSPELFEVDFTGIGTPLRDTPDLNADTYLDIAAGHMTFIRTIIERSSPTVEIMCEGVIHNDGDGDEADIADALQRVFDAVPDKTQADPQPLLQRLLRR